MTSTTVDIAGLDGGLVTLTPEALGGLDSRLTGRLLRPGDQGWDDAVRVWNAMAAKVPALIVQPASANDVAAAVGFARDHGLLLSIKGGGHNIAGTALADERLPLVRRRGAQQRRAVVIGGGAGEVIQDESVAALDATTHGRDQPGE
jgi:hypothetical protein